MNLAPRAAVAAVVAFFSAGPAAAQQNLFNVPSGKITPRGDLFFQQQFNFSRPIGASNTTVDVGLGGGWEAGFNVLDVVLYDRAAGGASATQQVNPDLLLNAQKGFELTDFWGVGVGGQFGANPAPRRDARFLNLSWVVSELGWPGHEGLGKWYAGAYYANAAYRGPGDAAGFLLGAEVPVVPERLSFQWDWVGGANEIGVAVIGGVYTLRSGWQVSLGAQVPSPRSGNPVGLVVELTLPGYPLARRGAR